MYRLRRKSAIGGAYRFEANSLVHGLWICRLRSSAMGRVGPGLRWVNATTGCVDRIDQALYG